MTRSEEGRDPLGPGLSASKSFYARETILEHLAELEDTYLAEEALAEHFSSGGRTLSMAEVLERYG